MKIIMYGVIDSRYKTIMNGKMLTIHIQEIIIKI